MAERAPDDSDRPLIERIADGDKTAFRELFEAYQQPLFRYLTRLVRSPEIARELVNDVMFDIWQKAGTFEARSSVRTWIYRIAHNKAVDHLRRRHEEPWDENAAERLTDCGPSPLQAVEQSDLRGLILRLLDALSAEHRAVIQLTYFDGLSVREIADVIDCPEATVKTRMFYARKQLKALLVEAGIEGAVI